MKPLLVLLMATAVALLIIHTTTGTWQITFAGRIGMAAMLLFTATGHFVFTKGMELMIPAFLPAKRMLVLATGVIETAAAAGLLIPRTTTLTGWLLVLFFSLIVPANINAAMLRIDYQKGTYSGPGRAYLWFRVPLQLLFIGWAYYCAARTQ